MLLSHGSGRASRRVVSGIRPGDRKLVLPAHRELDNDFDYDTLTAVLWFFIRIDIPRVF